MKIIILQDGKKSVADIKPYSDEQVWLDFEGLNRKKLYRIKEVRRMFQEYSGRGVERL